MPIQPRILHIAGLATALTGLTTLSLVAYGHLTVSPAPIQPLNCDPMPPNVAKLGVAVVVCDPVTLPKLNELGWPELRAKLQPGDTLHAFQTQVSGGHLVLRGGCYLGQTLAWVR